MSSKVAIITAAGSGMGAAIARKLASADYNVAILSSSGRGEKLADELGGVGVTGSNQNPDDLKRLVDLTVATFGGVDALVNSDYKLRGQPTFAGSERVPGRNQFLGSRQKGT